MRRFSVLVWIVVLSLASAVCWAQPAVQSADIVLHSAKIYTMDENNPTATAIAIKGDKILAVGSRSDVAAYTGPKTKVVNLKGATVLPGLIDSHVHFSSIGTSLLQVDCYWKQKAEIIAAIAAEVAEAEPGEWIQGRGFNQAVWTPQVWPTKEDLDAVSPNNPVYISRYCGHAAWVNSKALELAGITRDTPDPHNGAFLRDENGEPTGILLEEGAMNAVRSLIPPFTEEQIVRGMIRANDACIALGLTSVHDAGTTLAGVQRTKALYEEGALKIRIYEMIRINTGGMSDLQYWMAHGPEIGLYDNRYTIRAIKMSLDGALGARGAAMLEPYSDWPDQEWLGVTRIPEFEEFVEATLAGGWQPRVHNIGDRANRLTLDAYEKYLTELDLLDEDVRPVIEHAQILNFADIPRFKQLGVVASMQPLHATEDMLFAEDRVGPFRILGGYAWQTLRSLGVVIAGGSDAPVSSQNPIWGIHAAVTRQDRNGEPEGGWYPYQRLSREEALRLFTLGAAYAAFEEDIKGSLEPGKLADLVVLDRDIMDENEVPAQDIWKAQVLKTMIGGEFVYEK